jgi:integrase
MGRTSGPPVQETAVPLFVTVRSRTSPHRLRRTYATRLLEHGVDVRVVKELLAAGGRRRVARSGPIHFPVRKDRIQSS